MIYNILQYFDKILNKSQNNRKAWVAPKPQNNSIGMPEGYLGGFAAV